MLIPLAIEMLAVSGTVVNASVNLTRRMVAATHESESDRAHVRFSDLLMCPDLTDLRSTDQPKSTFCHVCALNHRQTNVYAVMTRTTAVDWGSSYALSANRRSRSSTIICSRSSLLMRTHSIIATAWIRVSLLRAASKEVFVDSGNIRAVRETVLCKRTCDYQVAFTSDTSPTWSRSRWYSLTRTLSCTECSQWTDDSEKLRSYDVGLPQY